MASQADSRATAFLFDYQAWKASRPVQRMSFAQRGMYLEMLIEQADRGSLPDDPRVVADIIGGDVDEWVTAWPVLRRHFVDRRDGPREHDDEAPKMPAEHDSSRRIINLRLDRTLKNRAEAYERKQRGGFAKALRAGAEQVRADAEQEIAAASTCSALLSDLIRSDLILSDEKKETSLEPPAASKPTQGAIEPREREFLVFPIVGSDPRNWVLTETQVEAWEQLFPNVDVRSEARKALAWVLAHSDRRKTARGMTKFLTGWVSRCVDSPRTQRVVGPVAVANPEAEDFLAWFGDEYAKRLSGARYLIQPKDAALAERLLATYPLERLKELAVILLTTDHEWVSETDRGIGILSVKASWLDGLLAEHRAAKARTA
jgi:hypothetical protein